MPKHTVSLDDGAHLLALVDIALAAGAGQRHLERLDQQLRHVELALLAGLVEGRKNLVAEAAVLSVGHGVELNSAGAARQQNPWR